MRHGVRSCRGERRVRRAGAVAEQHQVLPRLAKRHRNVRKSFGTSFGIGQTLKTGFGGTLAGHLPHRPISDPLRGTGEEEGDGRRMKGKKASSLSGSLPMRLWSGHTRPSAAYQQRGVAVPAVWPSSDRKLRPMLDVAFGEANQSREATELLSKLREANPHGTLYIGYPLLGAVDGHLQIDALLTCEEFGVVAFDLSGQGEQSEQDWLETLSRLQNDMFVGLETKLKEHRELRKGRSLAFEIRTMTLAPKLPEAAPPDEVIVVSPADLLATLSRGLPLERRMLQHVNAAIQTTSTMRPRKKRANVTGTQSKGAIVKEIEKQIANLDRWQKKAAIEYPEGPQRIRGLAGSGKTIVLAQKAALLHAKHPEWQIVVTFNTRSLYQQFRALRVCLETPSI
jgi:hypothetical protein